ncbi:roadblock/LC7 domain-containing protein [Streptomyces sp. NPDC048253]|uniref:roadblock/LC7 domain-containing protein n=1 Tax=unclassified Streptomyces TaxID=2593676 RepID=UPI0006BAAFAE|nr:Roadblock/LC7 family protein [Actinobacteria bacterium OV320]
MVSEPEILDELRRLRARVPQLTGALTAGVDGLVLAHDTPGVEPEVVAALTAAALGVAVRMADTTGQGDFRELLVRGVYGYVATYAAGESAVLTLLAQDRVNVGRLHLEGRRAGARIGELVDAWEAKAREAKDAAATAARTPPKTPAKPPVRTPAKPPIVRTRSARGSATTNARTTTDS